MVEKTENCYPPAACHPYPLAKGIPGEGYSWHWSVYQWLEGENASASIRLCVKEGAS